MKIRTALALGLIVLNGSAYAMVANQLPLPDFFSQPKTAKEVRLSDFSVSVPVPEAIPEKPAKIHSKLDSLIAEYQVSRALSTSS